MFCPQFSCPPDHAIRVPRRPGARSDFFEFSCEQLKISSVLDHKILSQFGVPAQRLQVKNQHVPHRDLLPTPRNRTSQVGHDDFCRQPETKRSAQYPAQVESSAHVTHSC